jgi:serine/threonine protein kinase
MTVTAPSAGESRDERLPTVPGLSGLVLLARGGYATVYRALQESVSREVAVKVENRTLASERDRHRFLHEARAAGRMSSHPHVVDLFDAGVTVEGHPYLIMELCDASYADRMRSEPLDAVETRDVGVKIADALADAHVLGVLHRDVKPANILITRFGEPALADFGLAILAETRDPSVMLDVLTPAYAPPELFGHGRPTPAVDVYALCATLYAVMRGRPPRWADDQDPSLASLIELFDRPVPDLPGVPVELTAILRAGMANEPAARPSAERLRDQLAALPFGPAATIVPADPVPAGGLDRPGERAAGASVRGSRPASGSADTPTVPTRRFGWPAFGILVAGLIALALLIGGSIWYGVRHAHGAPAVPESVRLVLAEHVLGDEVQDHFPADRGDAPGPHSAEHRGHPVLGRHAVPAVHLDSRVHGQGSRL